MPVLRVRDPVIDAEPVRHGQGADREDVRGRFARLVSTAERIIRQASHLIQPKVPVGRLAVEGVVHERIMLVRSARLRGPLVAKHLAVTSEVLVLLCMVGDRLERMTSRAMISDPVSGLALDGLGSAAVEAPANAACGCFDDEAQAAARQTSIPLRPGMFGWSVGEDQLQIFRLIRPAETGVRVTPSWIRLPRTSLLMVLGMGERMVGTGKTRGSCTMRLTRLYQGHHA